MIRKSQKKVSKEELLTSIAELADTSKSETNRVLIAFYESVLKYLTEGREVSVPNFGTLKVRKTKEGMYYNYLTSKDEFRPSKNIPSLKISSTLKEALNSK